MAAQDVKLIFGNIPPIYKVHCEIKEELMALMEDWTEDCLVGQVISKHVSRSDSPVRCIQVYQVIASYVVRISLDLLTI